ncbi:MAG: hypothetical protein JWN56_455 [Sphingobacteriales bacterium]|nr:hypothetical protein [Sphingobacteriales bacterium]
MVCVLRRVHASISNFCIMENSNKELVKHLNHLVTICKDGVYGYQNAAEDADSEALKAMFMEYSNQRETAISQLNREIRKLGGSTDEGGGPLGAMHRAWMDLKAALSTKDNKAVLGACLTGERAAINAYNDVLAENYLPIELRSLLAEQRLDIQDALYQIETLHQTIES